MRRYLMCYFISFVVFSLMHQFGGIFDPQHLAADHYFMVTTVKAVAASLVTIGVLLYDILQALQSIDVSIRSQK